MSPHKISPIGEILCPHTKFPLSNIGGILCPHRKFLLCTRNCVSWLSSVGIKPAIETFRRALPNTLAWSQEVGLRLTVEVKVGGWGLPDAVDPLLMLL